MLNGAALNPPTLGVLPVSGRNTELNPPPAPEQIAVMRDERTAAVQLLQHILAVLEGVMHFYRLELCPVKVIPAM
jgi:hypothetical protein